jgi:tetratricopeptide (TPR) repeat protein
MMTNWNSRRPVDGLEIASAFLFITVSAYCSTSVARDQPAPANARPASERFAAGSEVLLKLPGLPVFDDGRVIADEDDLTFFVERSESGRLMLVSRDEKVHCTVFSDEVVPLSEAKSYFDRVALNDLRNPEALWVLGRLCAYQNNDDRAKVYLNRAVRLAPDQARFYLSRSLVSLRRKEFKAALDDAEKVCRLDPQSSQGRLVHDTAQQATQDYESAIAAVEQAFRVDCTNPFARPGTNTPKDESAERPGADSDLETPEEIPNLAPREPQTAPELYASGQSWYEKQEYDKAKSAFDAALKLDPRFAAAYAGRARVWVQKHYRDREVADYNSAILLEPGNATFRVARAECWSARGLHTRAMADFDEALRLDPANPSIWVSRGNEWRRDLKIDLAIADYTQAIQLDPKYLPAYIARANTWKQIRRFDRVIHELSDLIRLEPNDPIPHQTLARVLATAREDQFRNGKWALEEATRACELTHWIDPDAFDTLAAASAETGDFPSAIKWQNLAIQLVRQHFPSALQKKAISVGGGRGAGVGFDDRLAFYKSKKPVRE